MKKMFILITIMMFVIGCSKSIPTNNISVKEEFHESGKLKSKIEYMGDVKHGDFFVYHENGQLKGQGFFKNDKLDGKLFGYNENGIKEIEMFHKDGIEVGTWIKYEGDVRYELQIVDGKPSDMSILNDKGEIWLNDGWVEL